MLEQLLNSPTINYLSRGMTAATMRQEVISHNIANVNTPNYRRSVVNFEETLAKELYGEDTGGKLQMTRTRDNHLPAQNKPIHAVPTIVNDDTTIMREDENNVDIDIEMANLLKNQLYYNAMASKLKGHFTKVRNIITSGQN